MGAPGCPLYELSALACLPTQLVLASGTAWSTVKVGVQSEELREPVRGARLLVVGGTERGLGCGVVS